MSEDPTLRPGRELALGPDAVPQLEQHPVAAHALEAEFLPGPDRTSAEIAVSTMVATMPALALLSTTR